MKRMNFYYKRPVMTDACSPQEGTGSILNYCWLGHTKDHGKWFVPTSLTVVTLCMNWHSIAHVTDVPCILGWDDQGEMDTGGIAELWEMVERFMDILWEAVLFWQKGLRIIFWQRHWYRERLSVCGKSSRQNRHFLWEKENYFFSWKWGSVRMLSYHRSVTFSPSLTR